MKKIAVIALILGLLVVALVSRDDALSPVASDLSARVEKTPGNESRAYRILLGIGVSEDDDPFEVGGRLINEYQRASADSSVLDEVDYWQYPEEEALNVPSVDENDLYCRITDSGCLDRIMVRRPDRDEELARLSVLSKRYDAYLAARDFRTELGSSMNEPWPNFRYLFVANTLGIFAAFDTAEDGEATKAINGLLGTTGRLRELLVASDSILHKAITIGLVRDNLEAIAFIHSLFDASTMSTINRLTPAERSFEKPLLSEYLLIDEVTQVLDGNPSLFSEEGNAPTWLVKLFFQRNKLLNSIAENIESQIALSLIEPSAFATSIAGIVPEGERFHSIIPSVNAVAAEIADVDYLKYIARTFDLDVKIALVNAQLTGDTDSLVNPYYPNSEPTLNTVGTSICMDGPMPDEKMFRCLDVLALPTELLSRTN